MSAAAHESNLLPEGGGGGSSSSRKRQKLEVIRHPHNFKVEEGEEPAYAGAQHPPFIHAVPLSEHAVEAEEEEEEAAADEEDEDDDREQQRGPLAAFSATLVASPVYPNAIKWSEDNLLAVATSQLITILNPALIDGPRGFVTASSGPPFVVGTVQRKDIDASCLLPIRLSKDVRAVVRSIDWSPQGLAPNGGCLLTVCTKDHRVKLYRAPHDEYHCEWVQMLDLSEMLYRYHLKSGFKVAHQEEIRLASAHHNQDAPGSAILSVPLSHQEGSYLEHRSNFDGKTTKCLSIVPFDLSLSAGIETKFVMDSEHYVRYTNSLAYVSVSWSPAISLSKSSLKGTNLTMALVALGAKSGEVSILRCIQPTEYTLEKVTSLPEVSLVAIIKAHDSWASTLSWSKSSRTICNDEDVVMNCMEEFFLATGSSNGSVKLWVGEVHSFMGATTSSASLKLLRKVVAEDHAPVTSVALIVPSQSSKYVQIAVGRASGGICTVQVDREGDYQQEALRSDAHLQAVTGVMWAFDGRCLYSCSQDNSLHAWKLNGRDLQALPFPEGASRKTKGKVILSNSVLDGYYGLGLSKGGLALATVRGVSAELLDQMYESRAMKALAQVFWVGSQHFNALPELNSMTPVYDTDYLQWESSLLAALHQFENRTHKLVLWDIIACFTHASAIVGKQLLHSTVYKWLSSLGLVHSETQDDGYLVSLDSQKGSLLDSSCRRLQIVYVILKRLLEYPGSSWHRFFLDVEHELRERLVHLVVSSAAISLQRHSLTSVDDGVISCSGVIRMLQWAAANSSKVSPQLLNDGKMVLQRLKGNAETELCSTCKAKVPFVSAEVGECQSDHPHKLPRCSVTFELCPPNPLWFCNCCGRRASKQTPRIFLASSSRQSLVKLESPDVLQETEPTCPFCGILMQRYLPDCFLRLSLI